VRQRVARSRELVAAGYKPTVVARVAQITRQAIYRTPKTRPPAARCAGPPADEVEHAIVAVAEANPTDGYRMVWALVRRKLGRAVNRKRVLRVMRERELIQRRTHEPRRRRPGFFRVERPGQLWHLDMTSIWVAEHGWVYLNAMIDCCTREIVGWDISLRCRAKKAIAVIEQAVADRAIAPDTLTIGTDNGSAFTARATRAVLSPGSASPIAAAATATPRARRSSNRGSPSSRSARSGAWSSKPSTSCALRSRPTSTATTTGPTRGSTTGHRRRSVRPGTTPRNP
jgi:putative transposase